MKVTARIIPAKEGALWLFVDRTENKTPDEDLNNLIKDTLDVSEPGDIAYAIVPEEVKAIRDACNEWLKENK